METFNSSSPKYVNVAVDIETSGLSKGKHEILEIGIVVIGTGIKFNSYIKPMHPGFASPQALEVNGLDLEDLAVTAPTPMQVRALLMQWKEELFSNSILFPLGHNYAGFDKGFLELFLGDLYGKIFHYQCKDSLIVARALKDVGKIPKEVKCSLSSLAEHFSIPVTGSHSAINDCLTCIAVYEKLLGLI